MIEESKCPRAVNQKPAGGRTTQEVNVVVDNHTRIIKQSGAWNRQPRITDNFSIVPHGLWTAPISTNAKLLLGWLHSHDPQYLQHLTLNRIRRELGVSGHIQDWLDELAQHGYVTITKTGYRYRYTLNAAPWEHLANRPPTGHHPTTTVPSGDESVPLGDETVPSGDENRPLRGHIEYQVEEQREDQLEHQPSKRKKADADPDFDRFWAIYPRRIGKGAARKAWATAITTTTPDTIILGLQKYAPTRTGQDPQYTPHPATWLNQQRWEDEPETPRPPGQQTRRQQAINTMLTIANTTNPYQLETPQP